MRRVERLKAGGIVFHEGFEVGRDATLDELRSRHDALLIATGVYKPRAIDVARRRGAGVVAALDYLTASNRKGFGDAVPAFDDGSLDAAGKHVVVIGGGDTAMDCVRTAVRQGAASGEMPLPPRPRQHARIAARGRQCRGGRRRVRLALRARSASRAATR